MTNGNPRFIHRIGILVLLGYAAVQTFANIASRIADNRRAGNSEAAWQVWTYEGSSLAAWLVVGAGVWWLASRLRPPRYRWLAVIAGHLAAAIAASALHVGLMIAIRHAVFLLAGSRYVFTGGFGSWPYELRKDLATYLLFLLAFAFLHWLRDRTLADRRSAEAHDHALEVRDGDRTLRIPFCEISHVEAAGNYVELHANVGRHLHRATLAALEAELAEHGFRRIHRSRLVRVGAVRAEQILRSGDFILTLESGDKLRGSRRYRGAGAR